MITYSHTHRYLYLDFVSKPIKTRFYEQAISYLVSFLFVSEFNLLVALTILIYCVLGSFAILTLISFYDAVKTSEI